MTSASAPASHGLRLGFAGLGRMGEYHGFVNTSGTERAVMVWCYGGAASLEQAGYAAPPGPQA